jgi:hypothetical protein
MRGSGRLGVCHSMCGGEVVVARVLVVRVSMWSSSVVMSGMGSSRRVGLLILFHRLLRCSIECVYLGRERCCVLGCLRAVEYPELMVWVVLRGKGAKVLRAQESLRR